MIEQSPIETLASYALAFAAGAISAVIIVAYGEWMKSQSATLAVGSSSF